jgi:hypothetical protein
MAMARRLYISAMSIIRRSPQRQFYVSAKLSLIRIAVRRARITSEQNRACKPLATV